MEVVVRAHYGARTRGTSQPAPHREETRMTDPWAAAQQSIQAAKETPAGPVQDMSNPFATQAEGSAAIGSGGQWDPRVPFDLIEGRMVVMVPKSYRNDAPIPAAFNPKEGETREEYRVDLVILDGSPFSFEYNFKASKDAEPEKRKWEVTSFPSTHRGQTIAQGQLVRALKGVDKEGKFLYGVMAMVPQLRDQGLYPTPEKLAEARKAWIAALTAGQRGVSEPRYTWGLDDRPHILTTERINLALAWWETEKATRLNTAS